jgi:hypothetical protein
MRIYIIGNDGITLCREAPAAVNEGEIAVASNEELHAAPLSGKRLLALWNALPSVEKRKKVGDRDALIDHLWSAIEALPDPEPEAEAKRPSKQDAVIAMLRRREGATVDEVASATGWQRHTVRGVFSGTLKKKLGLTLASAKEERGRVYRIAEPASIRRRQPTTLGLASMLASRRFRAAVASETTDRETETSNPRLPDWQINRRPICGLPGTNCIVTNRRAASVAICSSELSSINCKSAPMAGRAERCGAACRPSPPSSRKGLRAPPPGSC